MSHLDENVSRNPGIIPGENRLGLPPSLENIGEQIKFLEDWMADLDDADDAIQSQIPTLKGKIQEFRTTYNRIPQLNPTEAQLTQLNNEIRQFSETDLDRVNDLIFKNSAKSGKRMRVEGRQGGRRRRSSTARKSSSRRGRRSSKKRATKSKPKRRQRRASRRAY